MKNKSITLVSLFALFIFCGSISTINVASATTATWSGTQNVVCGGSIMPDGAGDGTSPCVGPVRTMELGTKASFTAWVDKTNYVLGTDSQININASAQASGNYVKVSLDAIIGGTTKNIFNNQSVSNGGSISGNTSFAVPATPGDYTVNFSSKSSPGLWPKTGATRTGGLGTYPCNCAGGFDPITLPADYFYDTAHPTDTAYWAFGSKGNGVNTLTVTPISFKVSAPACVANTSCAANTCTGSTCSDGCGGNVAGTKTPGNWSPDPTTVCFGTSFTQTSDCGTTRATTGTKTPGNWSPDSATVCSGTSFTQTSDCGTTRSATGTKNCTVPVNGTCGAANGGSYSSSPVSGFCATGAPTAVTTNPTTYTWSCTGSGGGSTATCSATRTGLSSCASPCGVITGSGAWGGFCYQTASVACGATCAFSQGYCNNGTWTTPYTAGYVNASCSVQACSNNCTGIPTNATVCPSDNAGLVMDTPSAVVATCSSPAGSTPKCEYTCSAGYHKSGNTCVADCSTGCVAGTLTACSPSCGSGTQTCTMRYADCTTSAATLNCSSPACPSPAATDRNWKEVAP